VDKADIAVIGGGIIGMSCAYELARQSDARIVVFDKSLPASGTTGGSAGVICLHDIGATYTQLTLLGFDRIQHLRREHGFGFQAWGCLSLVSAGGQFPAPLSTYEHRFGGGADSIYFREELERSELMRRYPWLKPNDWVGATLYPNQGYVDTHELVSLYEKLAVQTGRVSVQRNVPVLQMRQSENAIHTLVTRKGAWQVGQVLNAAGPWGAKVAALAGSKLEVTPQRIQVCVATAFDDNVANMPLWSAPKAVNDEAVWCRGEVGNTLLFGQHHHTTKPGYTVDPDVANRVNDDSYPGDVAQVYAHYFHLPKSVFLNGWCCVYGTTQDGFPIISRDTTVENLYHAVGLNGHGMTCHAGVALATTALMLRGDTTIDLAPILGKPEVLDIAPLHMGRFAAGELLDFELR
jgi:sarcosine oxidase subunit beta